MPTETGTIDLMAQKAGHDDAAKTATNYIRADETGIRIADSNPATATTYQHQTATETEFVVNDVSRAAISGDGARFGKAYVEGATDNETHLELDYHSLQLMDKEGGTFLHVSDLRDHDGIATVTETMLGSRITYSSGRYLVPTTFAPDTDVSTCSVTIDGVETEVYFIWATSIEGNESGDVEIDGPVDSTAEIVVTYLTRSRKVKAYTLGIRLDGADVGYSSYAMGFYVEASGLQSFAGGHRTRATGDYSYAIGTDTIASGSKAYAEGSATSAEAFASHAEGAGTTASDACAHAEGWYTTASGVNSHAEGRSTTASGGYSHAEGYKTTASGYSAHAEGAPDSDYTPGSTGPVASGACSHAEGADTVASGNKSHAEGYKTTASGYSAHVEGTGTQASGDYAHAQNMQTRASSSCQTAIGQRNVEDTNDEYALIIGNGTSNVDRSNAATIDWDGNYIGQAMAGIIQMFAGPTPPTGWLECDGSAVSREDYATLFAAIGTTWGAGDGSTTFNLPDLRGRSPIGAGAGSGLTSRTLGGNGGSENIQAHTHGFTNPKIPNHVHTMAHTHPSMSDGRAIGYNYGSGSGMISTGVGSLRVSSSSSGSNYVPRVLNSAVDFSGFAHTGASSAANTGNPTNLGATTGGAVGAVSGATTGSSGNMQPFAVVKFIICTGKTS